VFIVTFARSTPTRTLKAVLLNQTCQFASALLRLTL
jgi:hypothetical protein